jgi:triosephosphate isomerase
VLSRAAGDAPAFTVGVSLKMYFGHARTLEWMRRIAEIARMHEATASGAVELFVVPTFPALVPVGALAAEAGVALGAQDLFWEDAGAFTGEVSGLDLAALDCEFVELGHAERRELFGEDDAIIGAKLGDAVRNGLTPVLCVGESNHGSADSAASACISSLERIFDHAELTDARGLVVAYEPEWAIGADHAASVGHVAEVAHGLRDWLATRSPFLAPRVIYGGSAGPGTLTDLGASVDGLFLGRFAHDPDAMVGIVQESVQRALSS